MQEQAFLFLFILAIATELGYAGHSYISPFYFEDAEGHEIENRLVGIHKQDVNVKWNQITRFGKLGANMWPYGDRPSRAEFEAWLEQKKNSSSGNQWAYFCQPAADPAIQHFLSQPQNIEAFRKRLTKAVSPGRNNNNNNKIAFMTPTFLDDLYCKKLTGAWSGMLNTKMIGYGTAWFVSPYGATPFLFEGRYDPGQHLYFCPHSNRRYYTALAPPPLCPKSVDSAEQGKTKLVRMTIYVPQIVMFSRRCDVCYVKNTHVHTYENFWSAKEQCGVCPTTVDKKFINATTCRNWLPGKSCYWPKSDFMADVLLRMTGSSGKSEKVLTNVGRFTKFDTGARTNNEIYYDYNWCGTKNYVITNCYRETGDITTRGPAFKSFDSRWGQLSWREALSGRAQVGPYKYSMHFKPFDEQLLCPYTPTVTVSNVRYTETDSKEFDLGVRANAQTIITLVANKLRSVFTVDDTQKISTAPKCLPKDGTYYHLSEDRIIMISNMEENNNDNSLETEEEKIVYHEGHSDLMKVQSGQEKTAGFVQSSKRTHALKTGPPGKPTRQRCADLNTTCPRSASGVSLNDQVQFLTNKIRDIINYNARLADQRACKSSQAEYENNRLLLRIFPSATMSKLLGQRVKVIGTGEKVFEVLPCQPVERFSIVQSLKTNNRAFLDPRYAYRVFVNKDVILDSGSNDRVRDILANSSAAGNGSENIVYLQHDVLQERGKFGASTKFPRRYQDVYTLLNLTVAPYTCFTRPVVEFRDPYDPRVMFIGQVDRDSSVALDIPYMGLCKKDAQHFFEIARIMFLFYQHQLIGSVSSEVLNDNKKRTELAIRLSEEARVEAKHEMNHKILGADEPPPKPPLRDLSQRSSGSGGGGGGGGGGSSISLEEVRKRLGAEQVYDPGDFYGRSQLIDFITNLIAVEGVTTGGSGKMHQLKKRYLFNVFDSYAYDLMKQFEKVEEQSYESVLKDLIIRTDVAQLSQIGEAGLVGGTDVPNITTEQLLRYQQMLMAGFHGGGGFGSAIGQGLSEVLKFGKDGLELVGSEVKKGAEGVVDFAASGVGNVVHKLFGGVFGKILIVLGSIAGVVLVVVVLFFLITRTQSRSEQKKTETRLANDIGAGGCAAGGEVWLNQSDENQFRQRKGYTTK